MVGQPMSGVKVVEAAIWVFGPASAAILSDLGAAVIKVEHPQFGDPQRGLRNALMASGGGPSVFVEMANRGKRSIGLDLASDLGRETLYKLVADADVFITNFLPAARRNLQIDVEDIRAHNPAIVYARASGMGRLGPEAESGGYDLAAGWGRGGTAFKLTPESGEPPMMPASFFDLSAAIALAGAIGMALYKREKTGETSVVDSSLLNAGMWPISPDVIMAPYGGTNIGLRDRKRPGNPTVNWYQTRDARWLYLVHLESDRWWPDLCRRIGRLDLLEDPRFSDHRQRIENQEACVAILDSVFAQRTLEEWKERLLGSDGVWAPVQSPSELHDDPQVVANGFLPAVTDQNGLTFNLVAPPMQFDETPTTIPGPAPEAGQHTEEVLLELGLSWDEIIAGKLSGAFQ